MNRKREKIIIVGGGVLGCALCWRLAEAGFRVVLLEKGDLARGASGGNLSQISVVDRLEDWHMAVTLRTLAWYRKLKEEHGLDYQPSGGVTVLRNETEMEAAEKAAEALRHYGIPGSVVTEAKQIESIEPLLNREAALGILHCGWEGKVDAFSATLLFARLAQAAGAEIFTHTEVTGFATAGGRVARVNTNRGNFEAELVVVAGGPWSGSLAEMAGQELPLRWHRGSALVSRPMPRAVNCTVVGGGFLLAEAAGGADEGGLRIGLGLLQNSHGSIFFSQATSENPACDREVELKGMVLMARQALRYFPLLKDVEILRAWAAPTTYTTDGAPVFGFSETLGNLFFCTGFKGAFSTALGVAEEAVKALQGQPTAIGGFAAPGRKAPRGAFPPPIS